MIYNYICLINKTAMKHIFFVFFLSLVTFSVYGQEPLKFTGVVAIDSTISKEELYTRARLWFSETFKNMNAVLDIQDKEAGELIGKGSMTFRVQKMADACYEGDIKFDIKVFVRNGRYKYEISDFIHKSVSTYSYSQGCSFGLILNSTDPPDEKTNKWTTKNRDIINWQSIKKDIETTVNEMIESLYLTMLKPTSKKDDW